MPTQFGNDAPVTWCVTALFESSLSHRTLTEGVLNLSARVAGFARQQSPGADEPRHKAIFRFPGFRVDSHSSGA